MGAVSTRSNHADDGLSIITAVGDESLCGRCALISASTATCPAGSTSRSGSPSRFNLVLVLALNPPRERPMT